MTLAFVLQFMKNEEGDNIVEHILLPSEPFKYECVYKVVKCIVQWLKEVVVMFCEHSI